MVLCYMTRHLISHINEKSQTDYKVSVGALREILGTVRQEVTGDEENWKMMLYNLCSALDTVKVPIRKDRLSRACSTQRINCICT
jgi:hypothetical protein